MLNNRSKYYGIDVFKMIMAFIVIAIHTEPLTNINNDSITKIYTILAEHAVPFFFLASGFFVGIKLESPLNSEKNIEIIKKQLTRMIKMYLVCTLIYSPLAIYRYNIDGTPVIEAFSLYIKNLVFFGEQHNAWHLWYLLSTIYALVLVLRLIKNNNSLKKILLFSLLFSVISISLTQLVEYKYELPKFLYITKKIITSTFMDGRIFQGLIYIPIGIYLSMNKFPQFINWINFILMITLSYIIDNQIIKFYLLIISSVSLFEIIKNIKFKEHRFYRFARKSSTIIFLIHMYVWFFYYMLVYGERKVGIDHFIVTSLISLFISAVYIYLKSKRIKR